MIALTNDSIFQASLMPGWTLKREPQVTLIIKATYSFKKDCKLQLAEEQPPLVLADEYLGDPECSSLQQCHELHPFKRNAEFYLFGKAYPAYPKNKVATVCVELSTANGTVQKKLLVLGDHQWKRGFFGITRTKVKPLEPVDLQYELAYGGKNLKNDKYLAINPAGRGFNPSIWKMNDPRAPRIEYEQDFQVQINRQARPAGYGPLPVHWHPRSTRQGAPLSESELNQTVCPWGKGMQPDMHQCAPDDQQLPGYLSGGETLYLEGFFSDQPGGLELRLPDHPGTILLCNNILPAQSLTPICDTLIINTEERQISLLYRLGIPTSGIVTNQDEGHLLISESFGTESQEVKDAS